MIGSVTGLSHQTTSIEFYCLDNYHSSLITFYGFFVVLSQQSVISICSFQQKKIIKDIRWTWNEKYSSRNRLFFILIWWISPLNVMIFSWKLCHSFSIPVATSPPYFSSFELSWTEIEFWLGCLKSFSIFLSWWFFELLPNFSRSRLFQYI